VSAPPNPTRLLALDALRGVAAMAVVAYHVPRELREAVGVPRAIDAVFSAGFLGVDAFFVLSGFVIAMSVANGNWTLGYLGRFFARRSVRLDPSYWAAIVLEILLGWIGLRFLSDEYPLPAASSITAHLLYLQGLLRVPQISDVFWTLCYEVQFYLLLVGLLVIATAVQNRWGIARTGVLRVVLLCLAMYSLAIRNGVTVNPLEGLMVERAYQFALGIVAFLLSSGRVPAVPAMAVMGGIELTRLVDRAYIEVAVTAFAVALCWLSFREERINRICEVRPLQFLGKISYSLYLYHASIVGRGSTVILALAKGSSFAMLPILGLLAVLGGSIAFSYGLYRLIEAPTMRLSKRITLNRQGASMVDGVRRSHNT
jgi:peptidoglycan/LPS O-acetylase OafA/YrhL